MYLPFERWEKSEETTGDLKAFLRAQGFVLQSGQLEVFPSGAGLRLPLQAGFAWLDRCGNVLTRRDELTVDEAIRRFVYDIESGGADWSYTKSRITEYLKIQEEKEAIARSSESVSLDGFEELFSHKLLKDNYEEGKSYWLHGLSKNGERQRASMCVEHYLWHGDDAMGLPARPGRFNDEERCRLILDWLRRKHNGCCNHINANDWKTVEADVRRACLWRASYIPERKPYLVTSERAVDRMMSLSRTHGRTWTTEDFAKGNCKRMEKARQKIEDAVQQCLSIGQQISKGELVRMTGCSPNTVKKHSDLWERLAIRSGDLEPGVGPSTEAFSCVENNEFDVSELNDVARFNVFTSVLCFDESKLVPELSFESGSEFEVSVVTDCEFVFQASSAWKTPSPADNVFQLRFWKSDFVSKKNPRCLKDTFHLNRFDAPIFESKVQSSTTRRKDRLVRLRARRVAKVQLGIDFEIEVDCNEVNRGPPEVS